MSQGIEFEAFDRELAEFSTRVSAIRADGENSSDTLEALFLELELAEEELRVCRDELAQQGQEASEANDAATRERALLRAVFNDLAIPAFVLDHEGVVRRANHAGAALLGSSTAYIGGKPFPVFIDLPARAVFRSRLSALLRSGNDGKAGFTSVLVGPKARIRARLMLSRLDPPSEARPLVAVAVLPPEETPAAGRPAPPRTAAEARRAPAEADGRAVAAMARQVDLITQATRLLLDGGSLSEPVMLQRVASLLRAEAADWVLVDLVRGDGLSRVVAAGPGGDPASGWPRELSAGQPVTAAPLHADVLENGRAVLHPAIPDEKALGTAADGRALLTILGASSVLSVPLRADHVATGVLTLVRSPERPAFGLPDLRVFEEIGQHLALALRTERRNRRRSETATALQASLLPHVALRIPGVDWAAAYRAGTRGMEVGGDFYDVFKSPGGWGVSLGDVCGKGEEAAAVTAMVRHGIRLLSLWDEHPASVLAKVNEAMLTQQETDRFITAVAGHLSWADGELRVEVASAGHPGAAVLRADGAVFFTPGGGTALGLFPDGVARTDELSLAVGDTLVLYTDGVIEMRSADGALYGAERLADVLARGLGKPAGALVSAIEDDINAFGRGGPDHDDVAIVAVRVTEVPG